MRVTLVNRHGMPKVVEPKPKPPASSWWADVPPERFYDQAKREQARMNPQPLPYAGPQEAL